MGRFAQPEREEDDGDRAVRVVPAHDVPELVGEDEALLLAVERAERAGIDGR
jgi:hypothetical protein